MKPLELLELIHKELKNLNINYEAHATIERIIHAYKAKLSEKETTKK